MIDDDFEQADSMAGGITPEVLPAKQSDDALAIPGDVVEYRDQLIRRYHNGFSGLIEKLKKDGNTDYEAFLVALIDEVIKETDHLLGNELVATRNGELRDASVISFKRAEILEKAIDAVRRKQRHDFAKGGGIDTESGSMGVVFKFFMSKAKESFDRMGMGNEVSDLFFRTYGDITENWKRELRDRLEEARIQR